MKKLNFLIFTILFTLLYSCQKKDTILDTEDNISNEYNYDNINNSAGIRGGGSSTDFLQEIQQWHAQQKSNQSISDFHFTNPLKIDINWSNSYFTTSENGEQAIFKSNSLDIPAHISFLKTTTGNIYAGTSYYIPDEDYYESRGIAPNIIDFTGKVLHLSSANVLIKVTFAEQGILTNEIISGKQISNEWIISLINSNNETEIQGLVTTLDDDDDEHNGCCCGAHCGGKYCGCYGSGSSSGGVVFISGAGNSNNPGGGGWVNHPNAVEDTGPTGGGGGSTTTIPECQQGSFWDQYDYDVKHQFTLAMADFMNGAGMSSCNDPFNPNSEGCVSGQDLQCMASEGGCFQPFQGNAFDQGSFTECMTEQVFTNDGTDNQQEELGCDENAASFISTYNLTSANGEDMPFMEFRSLIGGFPEGLGEDICGDQAEFNATVADILFNNLNQTLDLDDNEIVLKQNIQQLVNIQNFISLHNNSNTLESEQNLSQAIANAYADIFTQEGITILELGEVGDPNDPLWDIMKEQLLETIKELVADFIPGGTLITLGPELFNNLQDGEWMDAMYNAVDIVLNEADAIFPAAKVASFGLGLFVKGKHLKMAFDAFKKAKALGEVFLLKFYNTLRNRLNLSVSEVRDKFQWLGGVNAKLDDVVGSELFQKLKDEFGDVYVFNGKPPGNHPVFKLIDLPLNNAVYMELYPEANSGWNWTIEFSTGSANATTHTQLISKYKIRFDN